MRFTTFCLLPALITSVTATALITMPLRASADTTPSKSDAQALYNKIGAAIKNRDVKAVEVLTTPKAVNKTVEGKTLTRDEWMKSMDNSLKALKTVDSATFTVSRVKMAGTNLVVDNSLHMVGTIADPNGKMHKLDVTSLAQDTWTKMNGKWLLLVQKDVPGGKTQMDGKPFPPSAPK